MTNSKKITPARSPRPARVAAAEKRAAATPPSGVGRIRTHRIPSDEVQGPGSYVELRLGTWGEAKKARQYSREELVANPALLREQVGEVDKQVRDMVAGWNWLDDDGEPLPLPSEKPSIVDELTSAEVTFITASIRRLQEGIKN